MNLEVWEEKKHDHKREGENWRHNPKASIGFVSRFSGPRVAVKKKKKLFVRRFTAHNFLPGPLSNQRQAELPSRRILSQSREALQPKKLPETSVEEVTIDLE